jgi:hypothetical protein
MTNNIQDDDNKTNNKPSTTAEDFKLGVKIGQGNAKKQDEDEQKKDSDKKDDK